MEWKLSKYLILISLIFSTSQIFSQSQIKLLERAYKENSDSLMKIFFNNWKKDLPINIYESKYTDDTTLTAIELFKFMYEAKPLSERNSKALDANPNSLEKVDSNSYTIIKSTLLQNDLTVNIVQRISYFQWYEDPIWNSYEPDNLRRDTLRSPEIAAFMDGKIINRKVLHNFRPAINNSSMVFLDSAYSGIINYFVLGNFIKASYIEYDRYTVKRNSKEFHNRFNFIQRFLPISETGPRTMYEDGHTEGSGYEINASAISSILIDRTLTYARITTFRDCYETIYFLEKKNGEWDIRKKAQLCWCG